MKRIAFILQLVIATKLVVGQPLQGTINIKTPEVAAFNRNIEMPVSFYTGIPSISIPLYEIKIKDISVPVTLDYHAGGIRVDEEATWVGLGWSLSYGGSISRTVRGTPDEKSFLLGTGNNSVSHYLQLPTINTDPYLQSRAYYLGMAKDGTIDYMPDEFHYSTPGYSGKFMFSQTQNKFIPFPKEDVAFQFNGGSINLKLPNGVSVDFGEDGYSSQLDVPLGGDHIANAWYIKRINNNSNESISYAYDVFSYTAYKLAGQTYTRYSNTSDKLNTIFTSNRYEDARLNKITFPEGSVSFIADSRADMPTKLLSRIEVRDNQGNLVKMISFSYSYFYGNAHDILPVLSYASQMPDDYKYRRLRLDAITIAGATGEVKKYSFQYYDNNGNLPCKYSFAQDHFGFYNDKPNDGLYSFMPPFMPTRFAGGDRRVNPQTSNAFALKTVTYPEGGKTEFLYENNTAGTWDIPGFLLEQYADDNLPEKSASIQISSYSRSTSFPNPDYTDANGHRFFKKQFTIPPDGFSYLGLGWSCSSNFGISSMESQMPSYVNNVNYKLEKINDDGTRTTIREWNNTVENPDATYTRSVKNEKELALHGGKYEMTVQLTYQAPANDPGNNQPYSLLFIVQWREISSSKMINVGGLRIKGINYYSEDGRLARNKQYTYINPYALASNPNFTSGRIISLPNYVQQKIQIGTNEGGTYFSSTVSSNSTHPLETTAGSYSGYEYVDETDVNYNDASKNLKTSYQFSYNPAYFSDHYQYMRASLWEPVEWTRGKLKSKKVYKHNDIVLQEDYDYYSWSPHLLNVTQEDYVEEINTDLISYQYLKRISPGNGISEDFYDIDPISSSFNSVNCVVWYFGADNYSMTVDPNGNGTQGSYCPMTLKVPYFLHYTGFDKIKSKVTTTRDDNGNAVVQTENYAYEGTPLHYSLTRTDVLNSKKETISSRTQYPTDFSSTSPYDLMVQKHMLNVPVVVSKYRNDVLLQTATTNYYNWGNNIIAPQTIQEQKGANTPEIRVRYYGYDGTGNLLSLSKEQGSKLTYLWGYNHAYPVAKVAGADIATVSGLVNQAVLDNPSSDQQLMNELNKVRSALTGTKVLVTTYTYIPLVGMSSETDASGKTIYYEYDAMGRLKLVRDQNRNIIKTYEYHNIQR